MSLSRYHSLSPPLSLSLPSFQRQHIPYESTCLQLLSLFTFLIFTARVAREVLGCQGRRAHLALALFTTHTAATKRRVCIIRTSNERTAPSCETTSNRTNTSSCDTKTTIEVYLIAPTSTPNIDGPGQPVGTYM